MVDDIIDALDNLSSDDDGENEDSEASAHDVTDALGEDDQYWKSRNQAKQVQDALKEDDDED